MPNATTVDAPVTLLGSGRSGTSLVASLFQHHPDCAVVGETANVIFGIWTALRSSAPFVAPLVADGQAVPDDERAGRLVRAAFQATFPDDRHAWMQKPIGVPKVLMDRFGEEAGRSEAGTLYWRV